MSKYDSFDSRPYSAHMTIIQLVGSNKKVLDVGCATGQLAKRLVEKGCEVVGIEIDNESAQFARRYCRDVIVGDVEILKDLPYPEGYFDVIIFADVLEHLKDPQAVLTNLKRYLKKDGYILCSIPNVAHIYVRLNLLFGKWEYRDLGILDKTHLRFFTKKTAIELVERAGYKIAEIYYTPWVPLFKLNKFHFGRRLEYYITRLFPKLFALQFIIKAKR